MEIINSFKEVIESAISTFDLGDGVSLCHGYGEIRCLGNRGMEKLYSKEVSLDFADWYGVSGYQRYVFSVILVGESVKSIELKRFES